MLNVNSYRPQKATSKKSRDFLVEPKKTKKNKKSFNIKNDPKVAIRAFLYSLTSVVLVGIICFSAYNIIKWRAENDVADEQIKNLQETTTIVEVAEIPQLQVKTLDNDHLIAGDDSYWYYKDTPLIDVNLESSRKQNSEVAGWIQVPGTNINYPYVQTNNNEYYLNHSLNKQYNSAGWVFLDSRNNNDLTNKNQILYAHGRVDGSMFGSLSNILSKEWQDNKDNHVVKISNDAADSLWQVFSVYRIPVTSDYLETTFLIDELFEKFIKLIKDRSAYDFHTNVTTADKIITLSTCIGTNDRVVLHAKLIKIAQK